MNEQQNQRKRRKDAGKRKKQSIDQSFAFRLDPAIDSERRALEVLNHWREQKDERGRFYETRFIVTSALLALEGHALPRDPDIAQLGIDDALEQFAYLANRIDTAINRLNELGVTAGKGSKKAAGKGSAAVNAGYLQNLKKALKGDDDDE